MSARLRIGLVLGEGQHAPGGIRSVCESLSHGLARLGLEPFWLVVERVAEPGLRVVDGPSGRWPVRRVGVGPAEDLEGLALARTLEREAVRWSASLELDLVHAQHLAGWGLGLPAALAARGLPVMLTLHDAWSVCPRGQLWHVDGGACERAEPARCGPCVARTWPELAGSEAEVDSWLERREALVAGALDACARIFTPTASSRALLARHGAAFARVEVLPNPVRSPAGSLGPRRRVPGELRLGVLGSVQPSKGVLELARAVERVGAPLVLEVHGPRASYHGASRTVEDLEALAQRTPRVELHPAFEPEALAVRLANLDAVAVPSLWEEFHGLVAAEARLAGLPVLVSGRGGLGESGGLVVGTEEAAWEACLRELVASPARLAELTPEPPSMGSEEPVERLVQAYLEACTARSQAASSAIAAPPQV